ncbi:MAG: phosphodiester glycosidase family protein [Nitrospinota bacterium]
MRFASDGKTLGGNKRPAEVRVAFTGALRPALFDNARSRTRALIAVHSTILLLTFMPLAPSLPSASAQEVTADLLDQLKRAQKLLLGQRPCGGKIDAKAESWRALTNGLEARVLHVRPAGANARVDIHLIRIDPKAISIRVLMSRAFGREGATAEDFAELSGALAVTNAGYYDKDLNPLGLLVVAGKRKNRRISRRGRQSYALYEGVFLVKGGRPVIQRNEDYQPVGEELAVQAGPLLIAEGRPASPLRGLRHANRLDGRTVLSLDGRGRIVLWVTASPLAGMNWCELRDLMLRYEEWEKGPSSAESDRKGILWALNLDGGTSAQLFVREDSQGTSLKVRGTAVPVALGFFPRN